MPSPQTLIVVPTYEEAQNIGPLIEALRQESTEFHILVVDDNSPDGTGRIVQEYQQKDPNLYLLTRQKKDGLAGAYLKGFKWGLERDYDHIVQMDADFSHDPKSVPQLVNGLKEFDVAIGARYINDGGTSGWGVLRQGISRGGNLYARTILSLPYQDLTGGFNAWRTSVLGAIDLDSITTKGYSFQVELKYRAHRKGFRISEIPIHFKNRVHGYSKMTGSIVWEAAIKVWQLRGRH